jgi:hypothetical protein
MAPCGSQSLRNDELDFRGTSPRAAAEVAFKRQDDPAAWNEVVSLEIPPTECSELIWQGFFELVLSCRRYFHNRR